MVRFYAGAHGMAAMAMDGEEREANH